MRDIDRREQGAAALPELSGRAALSRRTVVVITAVLAVLAGPARPVEAGRCVSRAVADARVEAASLASERAYRAALRRRGLEPVTLGSRTLGPDELASVEDTGRGPGLAPPRQPGDKQRVIVGPLRDECGAAASLMTFARDRKGRVYSIERRERRTTRTIKVCGCDEVPAPEEATCGGGMQVRQVQTLYDVPDDLSYAGPITIAYRAREISLVAVPASGMAGCLPPAPRAPQNLP